MNDRKKNDIFQIKVDKLEPYDKFRFILGGPGFVYMEIRGKKFAVSEVVDIVLSYDEICEKANIDGGYVDQRGNLMDDIVHILTATVKNMILSEIEKY